MPVIFSVCGFCVTVSEDTVFVSKANFLVCPFFVVIFFCRWKQTGEFRCGVGSRSVTTWHRLARYDVMRLVHCAGGRGKSMGALFHLFSYDGAHF